MNNNIFVLKEMKAGKWEVICDGNTNEILRTFGQKMYFDMTNQRILVCVESCDSIMSDFNNYIKAQNSFNGSVELVDPASNDDNNTEKIVGTVLNKLGLDSKAIKWILLGCVKDTSPLSSEVIKQISNEASNPKLIILVFRTNKWKKVGHNPLDSITPIKDIFFKSTFYRIEVSRKELIKIILENSLNEKDIIEEFFSVYEEKEYEYNEEQKELIFDDVGREIRDFYDWKKEYIITRNRQEITEEMQLKQSDTDRKERE